MGASLEASICQCQIELKCVGRSLKASVYQNRSIPCSSPSSTLPLPRTRGVPALRPVGCPGAMSGSSWQAAAVPGSVGSWWGGNVLWSVLVRSFLGGVRKIPFSRRAIKAQARLGRNVLTSSRCCPPWPSPAAGRMYYLVKSLRLTNLTT